MPVVLLYALVMPLIRVQRFLDYYGDVINDIGMVTLIVYIIRERGGQRSELI